MELIIAVLLWLGPATSSDVNSDSQLNPNPGTEILITDPNQL